VRLVDTGLYLRPDPVRLGRQLAGAHSQQDTHLLVQLLILLGQARVLRQQRFRPFMRTESPDLLLPRTGRDGRRCHDRARTGNGDCRRRYRHGCFAIRRPAFCMTGTRLPRRVNLTVT
jgi:hypothetical protein